MKNIPFVIRGIIVLLVDALYLFLLLDNRIDGFVKSFIVYIVAIVLAFFTHGLLYNVFVGKKTIEANKKQLASPSALSRKKARDYWIMQGLILIALLAVTILKHIEISQM